MYKYIKASTNKKEIRDLLSTLYDTIDDLYLEDKEVFNELGLDDIQENIGLKLRELEYEINPID